MGPELFVVRSQRVPVMAVVYYTATPYIPKLTKLPSIPIVKVL